MEVKQATDVLIYIRTNNFTGFDNALLACMQNAVVNIDNEFIDTTQAGSGKVGSLIQSGYGGVMQGSGVIQTDGGDSKITGTNILRPTLEGSTCLLSYVVGNLEMHVNAKIVSLSFQSNVGSLWKFSATFQFTSEIITNELYDLTNYYTVSGLTYRRVSTTTENNFNSGLLGLISGSYIRMIVAKNGIKLTVSVVDDASYPLDPDAVGYNPSTGRLNFGSNLVARDVILILYY